MTDHIPAQWRDRGQIIAGLIAERDTLRREVEQLRSHCGPACPFRSCESCAFQGGESVAAQANPGEVCDNGGSKTAPGVASTNTGSLARSSGTSREGLAP